MTDETVAHPLAKLEWKTFRLESFRASWLDVLHAYERQHHTNLDIRHIGYDECADMVEKGVPGLNMGRVKWDKDGADVGSAEEVEGCRALWTDWNPEVLEDLVKRSRVL